MHVPRKETTSKTEGEPSGAAGGGRRRSQGNEKLKQAVGEVIQGWDKGLVGICPGQSRKLVRTHAHTTHSHRFALPARL